MFEKKRVLPLRGKNRNKEQGFFGIVGTVKWLTKTKEKKGEIWNTLDQNSMSESGGDTVLGNFNAVKRCACPE